MQISKVVRAVSFDNVEPGKIIRFFVEGRLCTAMKIYGGESEVEGVLFLSPHPTYKLMSLFFITGEINPWDYNMMLEFPDSVLIPDFASVTTGSGNVCSTGDLALHSDKTWARGETSTGAGRYIDMDTGQVIASVSGKQPFIISKWAILPTRDTKEASSNSIQSRVRDRA